MKRLLALRSIFSICLVAATAQTAQKAWSQSARSADTHVNVVFSGGHETDPRDHGRPVILIANALGVPPEVFREVFTHVHPARQGSGGPTEEEARKNKDALLSGLGKYGVTNILQQRCGVQRLYPSNFLEQQTVWNSAIVKPGT